MTKDREFYKTFLRLMCALMLQQAVVLSVNLADNIMLGGYSETALSGVSAVNQIQFILQQLTFAVINGMIVLSSQYWGQKRTGPIKALIAIAMKAALVIAAVLLLLVSLFPVQAVGFFTNDPAIVAEGVGYLSIVRWSYLFFAFTNVLLGGMRTVEKVSISLYVSLIALIINVSINYTLITGHFGFPEMGAKGAAVGTLTARVIESLIVAWYVLKKDCLLALKPAELLGWDSGLFPDFVRVTTPLLLSQFFWGVNTALQTVILGHMSSSAIAAHSISSTIFLFLKVMAVGAASAASIIVGKTVGAAQTSAAHRETVSAAEKIGIVSGIDRKAGTTGTASIVSRKTSIANAASITGISPASFAKIREYVRTLQILFILIGSLLAITLFFIRIPLLSLYSLSAETAALSDIFIKIEATVIFVTSYQMCMNTGVICGGGDTRYLTILDAVFIWCLVVPVSLLAAFYFHADPVTVLICLNCDQYLKCIPAFIYGNSYRWIRRLAK